MGGLSWLISAVGDGLILAGPAGQPPVARSRRIARVWRTARLSALVAPPIVAQRSTGGQARANVLVESKVMEQQADERYATRGVSTVRSVGASGRPT